MMNDVAPNILSAEVLLSCKKRNELIHAAGMAGVNMKKVLRNLRYEEELRQLQAELVDLQQYVARKKLRVAIIFEGRDAAGKGGSIKRFSEHLNPRSMRLVALPRPTEVEMGQWYFRRYIKAMPDPGEIVFFDRSWYNRAVVEPVMGFCKDKDYERFMKQVPEFEMIQIVAEAKENLPVWSRIINVHIMKWVLINIQYKRRVISRTRQSHLMMKIAGS